MFGNRDNLVRLAEILAKNPIDAPSYTYSKTTNDPEKKVELTSKKSGNLKIFTFKNPIPGAGIKLSVKDETITIKLEKNGSSEFGYTLDSQTFSFKDSSVDLSTLGNLSETNHIISFDAHLL